MQSPQIIIRLSREAAAQWEVSSQKAALKALEENGCWKTGSVLDTLKQGFPVWNPFYEYRRINKEHKDALIRFLQRRAIPERVLTNRKGEAISGGQAVERKVNWDIVFIRDDGWSLGAARNGIGPGPNLCRIAESMWQNQWVEVYFPGSGQLLPYIEFINQAERR